MRNINDKPKNYMNGAEPFHEYFSKQFYLPHNFVRVIIYLFITHENPNLKYNNENI